MPLDKEWLVTTAEKTEGVERGSVRVSIDQAAISFAVDSAHYRTAGFMETMNQKLLGRHLRLQLLRQLYKGNLSDPS